MKKNFTLEDAKKYYFWLQDKKGILPQNINETVLQNKDLILEFVTLQEYVIYQFYKPKQKKVTMEQAAFVVASNQHGFDFKLTNELGLYQHLLHYVAINCSEFNSKVIESIVGDYAKSGQSLNAPDEKGQTPLMYAMNKNNFKMFMILEKNGVDIFSQDIHGFTPLHYICKYIEQGAMKKDFLDAWVKAGYRTDVKDKFGFTVKEHLKKSINPIAKEMLQILKSEIIENNNQIIEINSVEENSNSSKEFTEEMKKCIELYMNIIPNSPEKGDALSNLVKNDVVDLGLPFYDKLLQFLVVNHKTCVSLDVIDKFLKAGIKTSILEKNVSVLQLAVVNKFHDVVLVFAKNGIGASGDCLDNGYGIINYAADYQDVDLIEKLGQLNVKNNKKIVDFNIGSKEGTIAVGSALANYNEKMLEVLIKYGADINLQPKEHGETVMHALCEAGMIEHIKLAIKHGAKVDLFSNDEKTPLHKVVTAGLDNTLKLELIDLLCINGASKTIAVKDKDGNNLLKIATTIVKNTEITKKLVNYYNLEQIRQEELEKLENQQKEPFNIFEHKLDLSGEQNDTDNGDIDNN